MNYAANTICGNCPYLLDTIGNAHYGIHNYSCKYITEKIKNPAFPFKGTIDDYPDVIANFGKETCYKVQEAKKISKLRTGNENNFMQYIGLVTVSA